MLSLALALSLSGQVFPTALTPATPPARRDAAASNVSAPAVELVKLKARPRAESPAPPPDGGPSVAPPAPPPAPTPPPAPAAPAVYSRADNSGQVWTHADPAWLERWIAQRNTPPVYYPPAATYAPRVLSPSPCGPRGCPRR